MLNWEKLIYHKIKRLLCDNWISRIYSDRAQMWVTDMTQMNFLAELYQAEFLHYLHGAATLCEIHNNKSNPISDEQNQ